MTYTIASTVTDETATVQHQWEIVDAIRPWYPEAPADVTDALDRYERSLSRDEPVDGLEAFLSVRLERGA